MARIFCAGNTENHLNIFVIIAFLISTIWDMNIFGASGPCPSVYITLCRRTTLLLLINCTNIQDITNKFYWFPPLTFRMFSPVKHYEYKFVVIRAIKLSECRYPCYPVATALHWRLLLINYRYYSKYEPFRSQID